jgi:hypothetical protein
MSSSNDTGNIVDLQQRQANQAAATDRVGELLKLVRTTALKRVNGLVSNLFENIDDALFDLAEKAENNTVQTGYFNGMREVRKKRQLVERMCQEHLGKIFRDFAAGKLEPMKPEAAGQPGEGLSGSSLPAAKSRKILPKCSWHMRSTSWRFLRTSRMPLK